MNRMDLQRMANANYEDACLLFQHDRHASAYYLAGFAVELAIKAAIARHIHAETIPDKQFINRVFTHKLDDLLNLAGLNMRLKEAALETPSLAVAWGVVANWSVVSRYEMIDAFQAADMLSAVGDPGHGVMQWLKTYW